MGSGIREEIILDGVREPRSDLQAAMVVERRLDGVHSGKSNTYPLDEVMN